MIKQFSSILFSFLFAHSILVTQVYAADVTKELSKPLELPSYSLEYSAKRDPFKDAVDAIALAKETQRNVLIEIGGNWCTWCHIMDEFLAENPDVYQALHQNFVVLKVNVSDANDNAEFMKAMPPVLGYPHMYVSTSSGKMILSKDTAELQKDGAYVVSNWLEFIDTWRVDGSYARKTLKINEAKTSD